MERHAGLMGLEFRWHCRCALVHAAQGRCCRLLAAKHAASTASVMRLTPQKASLPWSSAPSAPPYHVLAPLAPLPPLSHLRAQLGLKHRGRVKDDGVHVADWLSYLAVFVGAAAKRRPDMDIVALLQYVYDRLREGEPFELGVLGQLLAQVRVCGAGVVGVAGVVLQEDCGACRGCHGNIRTEG